MPAWSFFKIINDKVFECFLLLVDVYSRLSELECDVQVVNGLVIFKTLSSNSHALGKLSLIKTR